MSTISGALAALDGTDAASAASTVPEYLGDVAEAYEYLQACREREARAKSVLVEVILDARRLHEAKLADIAAALGLTRQYVQKLIREAERGEELAEREAAYWEAQAKRDEREHMRGLGFTAKDRQCGVCHRFKSAPSDVCFHCGDDPVVNAGADPDRFDRMRHDASYAGGMR